MLHLNFSQEEGDITGPRNTAPRMSKGGKFGGGPSSLDYLFGSGDQKPTQVSPIVSTAATVNDNVQTPPGKPPKSPSTKNDASNNYHRPQGQNLGNFITDRPTTRVRSPPGGESSIGYLFDDKK